MTDGVGVGDLDVGPDFVSGVAKGVAESSAVRFVVGVEFEDYIGVETYMIVGVFRHSAHGYEVLVAELMGHKRLDQTRRYSLPTQADRERAIASLPTDR